MESETCRRRLGLMSSYPATTLELSNCLFEIPNRIGILAATRLVISASEPFGKGLMMPRVLNKRTDKIPSDAVYVGRPSKWGNIFSHKEGTLAQYKVSTVEEAIEAYETYIMFNDKLSSELHELKGKDLVCWCTPSPCHADILLRLANEVA